MRIGSSSSPSEVVVARREREVAVAEKERERERGAVNSLVRVRPHLHDSYSIRAISPPVITIHVRISGGGGNGRGNREHLITVQVNRTPSNVESRY